MSDAGVRSGLKWYEAVYALALIALIFFGVVINKPNRVGVVDIDRLAMDLGVKDAIAEEDQSIRTELTEQLTRLQAQYQERFAAMTNTQSGGVNVAGDGLKVQQQALQEGMRKEAGAVVTAGQRKQRQIIVVYRARLQPYINEVARKQRLSLVVSSGPATVYSRASIDITDTVLAAAKPHMAEITAAVDVARKQ